MLPTLKKATVQRVVVLHVDVVVFETGNAKVVRSATCRDVNHDLGPRPGQGHFFWCKDVQSKCTWTQEQLHVAREIPGKIAARQGPYNP